ncbi:MAG: hypothetical protein KYX66_13675 [Blastomonas fulva]|uniref:hypothetical protein n=1 Tax=Blastomonas fulva TaxID=1550728 RepID=UPI0024E20D7D|nr:hypothetical protein [Blastomonas fulva]MDK2757772.1 hypothetical protein [Blastomonas fulva]
MLPFVEAVESALVGESWLSALSLSLTLPDICGRLQSPQRRSQERYVAWWNVYIAPRYTSKIPGYPHVFVSGRDAYALRCAYLHQGQDDIAEQRAREALARFNFRQPVPRGPGLHLIQVGDQMNLQVDRFCSDICAGVRRWMDDHGADERVFERQRGLLSIQIVGLGDSMHIR